MDRVTGWFVFCVDRLASLRAVFVRMDALLMRAVRSRLLRVGQCRAGIRVIAVCTLGLHNGILLLLVVEIVIWRHVVYTLYIEHGKFKCLKLYCSTISGYTWKYFFVLM